METSTRRSPAQRNNLQPQNQPHIITPKSSNVIAVGCKLPNGIHLDIREVGAPIQRWTLKGINEFTAGALIRPASLEKRAYINEGVPKEFFEHWMHLNKDHPVVKNNLVFAHTQSESVKAMSDEFSDIRHGFEPIDPSAPGRGIATRQDND